MKKFILIVVVVQLITNASAQNQSAVTNSLFSIIPKPLSVTKGPGQFLVNSNTRILVDENNTDLKAIGQMLSDHIRQLSGKQVNVSTGSTKTNSIVLTTKGAIDSLGDEGYSLNVSQQNIIIKAKAASGVFYGCQTLYQLLPAEVAVNSQLSFPGVQIKDKPRLEWRGLMLDVGRYFYSVNFLKKYIDLMAMHKLNTFHWHLTEDHGWRIEIKKYPRLTEIGAQRQGTQFSRFPGHINNTPHWGYYTQDQIREVVAYAKSKFVTVVPEIEMPGHTLAALAAYPELSCSGGPFTVPVPWAIQKDIYCAGNDQTFEFLQDVLSEVADLFPGSVIHIGGDEAPKDRWKTCAKCQARIKKEGLKDEHELQSYFIRRIENFLLTKNKKIIGWDEILEGGLAPKAMVMSWRGTKGGIEAAKQKHDVVMTPAAYLYLDYYQGDPYLEPPAIGGLLPLRKVYSYEPVPEELTAEEGKYVKGVQGNVWCEFIHSPAKVEYMTFPRAAALAEISWTAPALKNWDDFILRMETLYKRYDLAGINYSKSAYNVQFKVQTDSLSGKGSVSLQTDSYDPEIRYTLDGSEPVANSPVYKKAFPVNAPITIKAASFRKNKQLSSISVYSIIKATPQKQ
jgi:hexosaminidase